MIHIPVSTLEPNMVLASPVRHPAIGAYVPLHTRCPVEAHTIAQVERLADSAEV